MKFVQIVLVWAAVSVLCAVGRHRASKYQADLIWRLLDSVDYRGNLKDVLTATLYNFTSGFDMLVPTKGHGLGLVADDSLQNLYADAKDIEYDVMQSVDVEILTVNDNSFDVDIMMIMPNIQVNLQSLPSSEKRVFQNVAMTFIVDIPVEAIVRIIYRLRDCVVEVPHLNSGPIVWDVFYLNIMTDSFNTSLNTGRISIGKGYKPRFDDTGFDVTIEEEYFKRVGLLALARRLDNILSRVVEEALRISLAATTQKAKYLCQIF